MSSQINVPELVKKYAKFIEYDTEISFSKYFPRNIRTSIKFMPRKLVPIVGVDGVTEEIQDILIDVRANTAVVKRIIKIMETESSEVFARKEIDEMIAKSIRQDKTFFLFVEEYERRYGPCEDMYGYSCNMDATEWFEILAFHFKEVSYAK